MSPCPADEDNNLDNGLARPCTDTTGFQPHLVAAKTTNCHQQLTADINTKIKTKHKTLDHSLDK